MKNRLSMITLTCLILSLPALSWASAAMYISPSSDTITVGQSITFDIGLSNPTPAQSFDGLDLWLKFDPTKLGVQDTSSGNWTYLKSTSTQIYDSSHFPGFNSFGFKGNNEVDNASGWLYYSVGMAVPALTSSGTFAQVTFKALSLTASTNIYFDYDGTSPPRSTRVLLGGVDYLDRSGTTGATVAVVPEPGSMVLLGLGLGILGVRKKRIKK